MNITHITIATPATAVAVMPAFLQESVLGAPVQGGHTAVRTGVYTFGVRIAPATDKDVSKGVRAWNPPD